VNDTGRRICEHDLPTRSARSRQPAPARDRRTRGYRALSSLVCRAPGPDASIDRHHRGGLNACRTIIPPAAIRVVPTEGGQPWLSWIYRTRGRLADYGLSIKFQPNIDWRVYIIFQPFHHDDNGSLHLHYRSIGHNGSRYIDWPGKLNSLAEAKKVAGLWVELIQHYLRIQNETHRSCDRKEQHRAALEHHSAHSARPRHEIGSGIRLHLLIAGSHVEVARELPRVRGVVP
jgi:hypothetical protein